MFYANAATILVDARKYAADLERASMGSAIAYAVNATEVEGMVRRAHAFIMSGHSYA